ncbi:hypothetical protein B0H13DRAFT_1885432 [Mycena leptocephala]|nr:hypothetical protein B0H13DRAFT_1885432 [Mycena leptocephala]
MNLKLLSVILALTTPLAYSQDFYLVSVSPTQPHPFTNISVFWAVPPPISGSLGLCCLESNGADRKCVTVPRNGPGYCLPSDPSNGTVSYQVGAAGLYICDLIATE